MTVSLLVVAGAVLQVTALYCVWRSAAQARTAQGAVAWAVFLLAAPYLAVPLYAFFGHHRYRGYTIARRDSEQVSAGIALHAGRHAPAEKTAVMQRMEALSDLPVVTGNDLRLLIDGEQTFDALFEAIDGARDTLLVQFYILRDDAMGEALSERLLAAADRGVEVRMLYDPVGSFGLSRQFRDRLREGGVNIWEPAALRGSRNRFRLNYRNHRKTVVADGCVAFLGGLNVGEEYMGRGAPPLAPWRDTHLRVEGPLVAQLQLIFVEDWHWATGERLLDRLDWEAPGRADGRTAVLVPSGPADRMETGALMFFSLIGAAQRRVWIASPYFVPDVDVLSALKAAALGGVEVRILVPEEIDHYLPWLAAFAYFDEMRDAGVEIWRYQEGFMHQKAVLVDDAIAAVGTANLDNRSFRLNFEAMAVVFDTAFAEEVETMLRADFARASRLEARLREQPLPRRVGAVGARLLAPIL
jgi:cardiolipin synthase